MTDSQPAWRIRAAVAHDAAAIVAVIHTAYAEFVGWLDPPSGAHKETEASIRAWFADGGAAVAEVDGTLIGVVHLAPRPDALYLGRLAVLPAWRSRGVGRALVAYVEAKAGNCGLPRVILAVRIQLPAHRAYYETLSYTVVAAGSHAGYTNHTYYAMEKIITPAC